jgi:type II secretory pathway pseudopilin PulG
MNSRSGLSFADVLIIIAMVLLLAALAVPNFIKAPDYGNEEDLVSTNAASATTTGDSTNRAERLNQ